MSDRERPPADIASASASDGGTLAATGELRRQLDALAGSIRAPGTAAPPSGLDADRVALYRRLFFGNVAQLLAQGFPVLRRTLGQPVWLVLVDAFYRDHGCTRPLFTELPREFLSYLEQRADPSDPGWLHALAHYEWAELALQVSTAIDDDDVDLEGDLLQGPPVVSVLAWPLAYAWPVHRIGPHLQPDTMTQAPTWLLLHREPSGTVRFHELAAPGFRLLQRLDEAPADTGRAHLQALAAEAGGPCDDDMLARGAKLLQRWRALGVVRGTRA